MTFINLGEQLFKRQKVIPDDVDVVFVSDMYATEYAGGAELTTEALLQSCPLKLYRVKSSDVDLKLLESGHTKYWIFGNYANLDLNLIPTICANMSYSVIEYDYKYCKYRSADKHFEIEKRKCECQNETQGKLVSAFMYAARSIWWMSEKQRSFYHAIFPFLKDKVDTVLSSVFDERTFAQIKLLNNKYKDYDRSGWIVIGSPSWIKGTSEAEQYCKENGLQYEIVWDIPHHELLEKFVKAEGHVFLPKGADTCPRTVIEAKLLGCKLHINDNVQHKDEIWFNTNDIFDTEAYLYMSRDRFWNGIKHDMSYKPTISGYTTTKDCITQDYPFVESITSMLGFCDEVVVVDGGSTDGTWEKLQDLAKDNHKLVLHQQKRDWDSKRFAVFDGMQKALARSLCTSEYCWQQDSDEIVHEDDYELIKNFIKHIPKNISIISLPVVEYWGDSGKVRVDVNVWKWRVSLNAPHITHGIPKDFRAFDDQGDLYSKEGCDGCFYIRNDNYSTLDAVNFLTTDVYAAQQQAAKGNMQALSYFEKWMNEAVKSLPTVYHFSWFNIERKIKTYKTYWSKHWASLYNVVQDDIPENNMFFDKKWSDVSDDEIHELSLRLSSELAGWVFHKKVDFSNKTYGITINKRYPAVMSEWVKRNSVKS